MKIDKIANNLAQSAVSEAATPWLDTLTIGEVLRQTAIRFREQDAVVFCSTGIRWSWLEFDLDVDRVARALLAIGLRRGDRFGVWATNVPEWVLLQFATARIGVILVTINPSYRTNELACALRQAGIRGLALIDSFKGTDYFSAVRELLPELTSHPPGMLASTEFPDLKWLITIRGDFTDGVISWETFLEGAESVSCEQLAAAEWEVMWTDAINIQFTSGTTGTPKGATLSHRNILLNAWYSGLCQKLTSLDRICIPVPLYHCFGCVLGSLCSVVHGAVMVFPSESFHAGATLQAIETECCTAVYGVPTMFIAMLEHAHYGERQLGSLRTGIMAGSPCPVELMKRVTCDMGASQLTIGYGQTEASPLITQTRADDSIELRVGTIGRPLPGVEVRIVDPATGCELADGQQGELCCRGHNVMLGYYKLPEKTAEAIDPEGWLRTGDLALRESNGYYRITGRLRDLIIRGGENISPREVEEVLYQHPAVQDVQIIGVPDRRFGEVVMAWIQLRGAATATEEDLTTFCKARMAYFKVPHFWKFVDAFPVTVTGKIQKFKMREISIEELGLQDVADIQTA
ncbi:MAG: AMP-binding protein [Planctomycetaceae bacterium]|nr:AMP-binding protein [Planctomycetaceae bacterium]